MSTGFSAKFPISFSYEGDFSLNENFKDLVKQNFKTLLLTLPGERIMLPDFGIGIQKFLFENKENLPFDFLVSIIQKQITKYMPYITLLELEQVDNIDSDNLLNLRISYFIKPLSEKDIIDISI